jgi:hypothetical protein
MKRRPSPLVLNNIVPETKPVLDKMFNDSFAFLPFLSSSVELGNQPSGTVLTPGRKLPDIHRKLGIKRHLKGV